MAPQTVILCCAAFGNTHMFSNMLHFQKRRAPWLTARCLFFHNLLVSWIDPDLTSQVDNQCSDQMGQPTFAI
jgi:hypothetical protein